MRHDRVDQCFPCAFAAPQYGSDSVRNQVRSLNARQLNQPPTVRKGVHQSGRNHECQLGLAAATCPSQGHQAPRCSQHQILHDGTILLAPDEVRLRWQVVAPCGRHVARSPSCSVWRGHSGIPCISLCAPSSLSVRYSVCRGPAKHAAPRSVASARCATPRLPAPPSRVVLGHIAGNGLGTRSGVAF